MSFGFSRNTCYRVIILLRVDPSSPSSVSPPHLRLLPSSFPSHVRAVYVQTRAARFFSLVEVRLFKVLFARLAQPAGGEQSEWIEFLSYQVSHIIIVEFDIGRVGERNGGGFDWRVNRCDRDLAEHLGVVAHDEPDTCALDAPTSARVREGKLSTRS